MYLIVEVYISKDLVDCSNKGITTQDRTIVVPCKDGNITKENVVDRNYIVLEVVKKPFPTANIAFKQYGETRWTMFGGNFVYTSDSRFGRQYGGAPIKVHDRIEG